MEKFSNVVFADVNLKEAQIREEHLDVGVGGWPTIRYWNRRTGLNGLSYVQKTEKAMCTELGPGLAYMEEYVDAVESGEADTWDRESQRIAKEKAAKAAALRKMSIVTHFINKSGRRLSKSWNMPRGGLRFQQTIGDEVGFWDTGMHNDKFTFLDDSGCSFSHTNDGEKGEEFTVTVTNDDLVCPREAVCVFENNSGQTLVKHFKVPSTDELISQGSLVDGDRLLDQSVVTHIAVFQTLDDPPCTFSYTVIEVAAEQQTITITKDDLVCPEKVQHNEL